MKKIPTLFRRDPDDMSCVLDEVNPGCEWVLAGEGVATRKYDGTCTMLDEDGRWWARREVKPGKTPPENFRFEETDPNTGKTVGWEPIEQSPFVKFWREAHDMWRGATWTRRGTYELCGPKINGNPEKFDGHLLVLHADAQRLLAPRTFDELRDYLYLSPDYEGIVWHHEDGRKAKLKRRDFRFS